MAENRICAQCMSISPPEARFCRKCGKELTTVQSKDKPAQSQLSDDRQHSRPKPARSQSQFNHVNAEISIIGRGNKVYKADTINTTVQPPSVPNPQIDASHLWKLLGSVGKEFLQSDPIDDESLPPTEYTSAINHKTATRLRVFICHAAEDKPTVRGLYQKLIHAGLDPWLDEEKLLPGQEQKAEIRRAIRTADAALICLSPAMIEKPGDVHSEVRLILEAATRQPDGRIFLIPTRLEPCDVPDQLSDWQWVDLFADRGWERLLAALQKCATEAGVLKG